MKTYLYMFAVLACAVTGAKCIVCLPNACATVSCQLVTQEDCKCSGKIYSPNGGFCGCCPVCLTKIPKGGSCALLLLRGTPPTAACEEGTTCKGQRNNGTNETTYTCVSQ